jgi:hypothetical protein
MLPQVPITIIIIIKVTGKVQFTLEQATKARGGAGGVEV